jgi:hypothetical protein
MTIQIEGWRFGAAAERIGETMEREDSFKMPLNTSLKFPSTIQTYHFPPLSKTATL